MAVSTFWCLLMNSCNKPDGSYLQVNVSVEHISNYIADLREKIKERQPNALQKVDINHLELWKLPGDICINSPDPTLNSDLAKLKFSRSDSETEVAGHAKLLNPLEKLSTYWKESPEVGRTHIIVTVHGRAARAPPTPSSHSSAITRHHAPSGIIAKLGADLEAESNILCDNIYKKAWGIRWPRGSRSVIDEGLELDGEANPGTTSEEPSKHWDYTCLLGIGTLASDLGVPATVQKNLVIRDEYDLIRITMEGQVEEAREEEIGSPCFSLTGQPGIGKTAFLLYLLLSRLERRLPTAIQVGPRRYAIFDETGVAVLNADVKSRRLSSDYWALCDSNGVVSAPCQAFQASRAVIVQATSARQEQWKEWAKQKDADTIVMDLPRPLEIAAIAQEAGFDPAEALSIVQEWGPATRTVMSILRKPSREGRYMRKAESAAAIVARDPSVIMFTDGDKLTSIASMLLFLRPVRDRSLKAGNEVDLGSHILEIPTPKLADIFERVRANFSNKETLDLFAALSSHSLTRSAASWAHEKIMHVYMSGGGQPLDLIPYGKIHPTRRLLSGTVSALQFIEEYDSFYWLPSVANFEGIDGVLGTKQDIYALQATIADTHVSPIEGLRKVWAAIHPTARERKWHFVIVTDDAKLAEDYLRKIAGGQGLTLGRKQVPVNVWGCVVKSL